MWDPLINYQHLNYELAFPNFMDYGWSKFFRQFLRPSIAVAPATWIIDYTHRMNDAKTWSETGHKVVGSFTGTVTSILEYVLKPKSHSASTYISKNYIDK